MEHPRKIGVLGGGSWATALVKLLLNNCDHINWYIRSRENIEKIKKYKHNPSYLTSIQLNTDKISFYDNISETIEASDILIVAIPAPYIEDSLSSFEGDYSNKFIFSAVKGIVPQYNLTVSEFFNKNFNVSYSRLGIISDHVMPKK